MQIIETLRAGGFAMIPLLACSLAAWAIIFERLWRFRGVDRDLHAFHLEALNTLLRGEPTALRSLSRAHATLPTAQVLEAGLDRRDAKDATLRRGWAEAMERRRQLANQELRRGLWVLGTVASASPFIGLFGTVVGILRAFGDIAETGKGGFAVVAASISESLIATAAGIVVAVIAVMAYNAFQTRCAGLALRIRLQSEELAEVLGARGPAEG